MSDDILRQTIDRYEREMRALREAVLAEAERADLLQAAIDELVAASATVDWDRLRAAWAELHALAGNKPDGVTLVIVPPGAARMAR